MNGMRLVLSCIARAFLRRLGISAAPLPAILCLLWLWLAVPSVDAATNRAVLIGINDYPAGKLEYCVADATALRDALIRGGEFKAGDVVLITDDAPERANQPTLASIETRLENLAQFAGQVDTLVVFFAGHGTLGEDGKGYLMPIDGSPRRGIELSDVRRWLAEAKAKSTLLILDCCHAGKGARGFGGIAPSLAAGAGILVIASCDAKQQSYDDPDRAHGVFTASLLDGLAGKAEADKDGRITADALFKYVHGAVNQWAFGKNQVQTPVRLPEDGGAVISLARIPKRPVGPAVPDVKTPEDTLLLPGLPVFDASGMERVTQVNKALADKRAEMNEKGAWYAAGSAQMTALRGQESALLLELQRSAMDAAAPIKAELEAIDRAWKEGERKGLLPGHPEMKKLSDARAKGAWKALEMVPFLPYEDAVALCGKELPLDCGNGVMMSLALVPAGEFMMGSPAGESGHSDAEGPQHKVKITQPFYMGVYEVTQGQYQAVMGANPANFKGANNPVDMVSWNDAQEFCRRLSAKTGQTVRLPTEAEWEYACRAGTTTRFCSGEADGDLDAVGWYTSNSGDKTHAVGGKKPNAWGLYDMHGNVWEWCQSLSKPYPYREDDGREELNGTESRVLRGGSWDYVPRICRSAVRNWFDPTGRSGICGFRVVCAPSTSCA